jgi:hypothetical protein
MVYIYFRRQHMNPFTQILENGNQHLRQLRLEAHIAALQPKTLSPHRRLVKGLRRGLAKMLTSLAQVLDEPQVTHA